MNSRPCQCQTLLGFFVRIFQMPFLVTKIAINMNHDERMPVQGKISTNVFQINADCQLVRQGETLMSAGASET